MDVIREVEILAPVDDLLICLSAVLRAEWRPANQAFEHDRAHAPPVTAECVALAAEDLRGDVVWRADRGVSHHSAGFAPHVDLGAVADGEVDLIKADRVAVSGFAGRFEELLVVGVFVLSVEASA